MIGQLVAGEEEWILAMFLSSLVIPKKYVYLKSLVSGQVIFQE